MKTKNENPNVSKNAVEILTFLARNAFVPLTGSDREGFAGASDNVLKFEDDENGTIFIFDPTPEEGDGLPRLEEFDIDDIEDGDGAVPYRGYVIEKVSEILY